ncbi:MAG: hypothetical protein OFPII_20130 [Osedax symbiont Rs1]|nr:MAG: hypothetical protein OFPII_20130 [Osedax symbiont Rs1]
MELIKGQNISLNDAQNLVIDLGWRSLVTDLNMQAYGIFENSDAVEGQSEERQRGLLIHQETVDLSSNIIRSKDGRRFELNLNQIANTKKFTIALMLPAKSHYDFSKVKHIQAFINTQQGQKIATIHLKEHDSNAKTMSFLEIYQHLGQWKLKFIGKTWSESFIELTDQLHFDLPAELTPRVTKLAHSVPTAAVANLGGNNFQDQPIQSSDALRDGIKLSMGGSFSLTENYDHLQHLVWKVCTVPKLADLKLNVVALTKHSKVRNIEDFIYNLNPVLKGDGIKLQLDGAAHHSINIEFDKIPDQITKLCLIATRENDSKRFSSADFIKTKLESANTQLPVCDFTCETVNKNYNCIILLEIYRHDKQWKIKAVGQGYAEGLKAIGETYGFIAPRLRASVPPSKTVAPEVSSSTYTAQRNISRVVSSNTTHAHSLTIAPQQTISNTTGWLGITFAAIGVFSLVGSYFNLLSLLFSAAMIAGGFYILKSARNKAKSEILEANERFMLNLIKLNNYRISPFEVATNHTLSVAEATKILDDLCAKGAGYLSVKDDGAHEYVFDSLNSSSECAGSETASW